MSSAEPCIPLEQSCASAAPWLACRAAPGNAGPAAADLSGEHACRDTESMMPEIPDPKLTELGPESSGGTPADKGESSCVADELFTEPFQVCTSRDPERNPGNTYSCRSWQT